MLQHTRQAAADGSAGPDPVSVPLAPVPLAEAILRLRRGEAVALADSAGRVAAYAAETVPAAALGRVAREGGVRVALTGFRAAALGVAQAGQSPEGESIVLVTLAQRPEGGTPTLAEIRALIDPTAPASDRPARARLAVEPAGGREAIAAAVALAKLAGLLPACVLAPADDSSGEGAALDASEVIDAVGAAPSLKRIAEARVPLIDAEETRVIAFRPSDGGPEALAVVVGEPDPRQPVLVRLHSACLTGDLLGSLRCDCGDQLRGAIAAMARAGSGILVYLPQEGRGIGLANKLRAYVLQDRGLDTIDANRQLGFDADERRYRMAGEILRALGVGRVRLLTNNPAKIDSLAWVGIEIVERVPHAFPANKHNRSYLETKATRGGHRF